MPVSVDELMDTAKAYWDANGREAYHALIRKHGGGAHPRSVPADKQDAYVAEMKRALGSGGSQRKAAAQKQAKSLAEIHAELEGMNQRAFRRYNAPKRR